MIRTSEIKLGRTPRQEVLLTSALLSLRILYNAALEHRVSSWKKLKKPVSLYDQQKELTVIRSEDPEYRAFDVAMTRLTVFRRLDFAFKSFFRRIKSGETPGHPRFKGRGRFDTLVFGTSGWKIDGKKLILKGISGSPVFRLKGKIRREGHTKGLRLIKRADRWYAQFIIDIGPAPKPLENPKTSVGIDVGLKVFATLSTDETIEHPRFLRKSLEKLREAQRSLSRKVKGSESRKRAKAKLARVYEKVSNRRKDFVRQEVAKLIPRFDLFSVEDLDIRQMVSEENESSNRGMRRGIMDSGWGMFFRQLACRAEEAGKLVRRVDPRGTTQRCSECGTVVKKTLRDRIHECPACGLYIDRDLNAAINIDDLGRRSVADVTVCHGGQ